MTNKREEILKKYDFRRERIFYYLAKRGENINELLQKIEDIQLLEKSITIIDYFKRKKRGLSATVYDELCKCLRITKIPIPEELIDIEKFVEWKYGSKEKGDFNFRIGKDSFATARNFDFEVWYETPKDLKLDWEVISKTQEIYERLYDSYKGRILAEFNQVKDIYLYMSELELDFIISYSKIKGAKLRTLIRTVIALQMNSDEQKYKDFIIEKYCKMNDIISKVVVTENFREIVNIIYQITEEWKAFANIRMEYSIEEIIDSFCVLKKENFEALVVFHQYIMLLEKQGKEVYESNISIIFNLLNCCLEYN